VITAARVPARIMLKAGRPKKYIDTRLTGRRANTLLHIMDLKWIGDFL